MATLSPDMEREIERRIAEGPYRSFDELLRHALAALDGTRDAAIEWFETQLLKGLEGPEVEMDRKDWDSIEAEALSVLEAKRKT